MWFVHVNDADIEETGLDSQHTHFAADWSPSSHSFFSRRSGIQFCKRCSGSWLFESSQNPVCRLVNGQIISSFHFSGICSVSRILFVSTDAHTPQVFWNPFLKALMRGILSGCFYSCSIVGCAALFLSIGSWANCLTLLIVENCASSWLFNAPVKSSSAMFSSFVCAPLTFPLLVLAHFGARYKALVQGVQLLEFFPNSWESQSCYIVWSLITA